MKHWGVQHVQEARTGPAPVIILDEIGRFEASCSNFLTEIERALDSKKTVIAVLKKEPLPHLQELAERPDAVLLDLDILSPFQARIKLTRLFWPEKVLHWGLTLRLYQEEKSFGPGPMQLLEGVDRTGSLHQAASELGMAYSKAWKLIGSLEHQWGFPLLRRQSGGAKGGGSALTKDGRELLSRYQAMLEQVEAAAQQAFETCFL